MFFLTYMHNMIKHLLFGLKCQITIVNAKSYFSKCIGVCVQTFIAKVNVTIPTKLFSRFVNVRISSNSLFDHSFRNKYHLINRPFGRHYKHDLLNALLQRGPLFKLLNNHALFRQERQTLTDISNETLKT